MGEIWESKENFLSTSSVYLTFGTFLPDFVLLYVSMCVCINVTLLYIYKLGIVVREVVVPWFNSMYVF